MSERQYVPATKEQEEAHAIRCRQWECGKKGNHKDNKTMVRQAKSDPFVCVFCGISQGEWEVMEEEARAFALYGRRFP